MTWKPAFCDRSRAQSIQSTISSDTFDPLGHYVFDDLPPDVEYSDNEMEFEFYKEDPPCTYHVVLPNEDG